MLEAEQWRAIRQIAGRRMLILVALVSVAAWALQAKPGTAAETRVAKLWGVVTGSRVSVRSGPALTNDRIGAHNRGTRLEWLGRRDGWVYVRHPQTGQTGWMSADFVSLVPLPKRALRRPVEQKQPAATPARRAVASRKALPRSPRSKQRLFVYGDSLATNLFHGLQGYARRAGFYTVQRRTRGATGLIRDDQFDWYARTLQHLKRDRPDILVVTFGGNDRQDITKGRRRIRRFTPPWWKEYRRRINRYMAALKRHVPEVYWLGLPVVRSRRMTASYAKFNQLYREYAARNGITYVDSWRRFQAPGGGFRAAGPDIDGKVRQLRHKDGIHFRQSGSMVLAKLVVRAIRKR